MNKFIFTLLSVWTSVSVFSSNDFALPANISENQSETVYQFAPDADSPGVEVAPLQVNKKDEDVPNELAPSSIQNEQENSQKPILLPIQPVSFQPEEQ